MVLDGNKPLNHIHGLEEASKTACGIRDCVELTATSSMAALAGHIQNTCKSDSLAKLHLGQITGKDGYDSCILCAGQHAAHMIVSRAACCGYSDGIFLRVRTYLSVVSQSMPNCIPYPL